MCLPGQLVGRQEAGGQARMALVRFPSDALIAVAPSSHCKAAQQASISGRAVVQDAHHHALLFMRE